MVHNRTAASLADRLLAHTQAFAHTPKKQKNNPMKYRNLECSVGKGAPRGMVLVANPVIVGSRKKNSTFWPLSQLIPADKYNGIQ